MSDIIKQEINKQNLIIYLKKKVGIYVKKIDGYNKIELIKNIMDKVEVYFSNQIKSGEIKKSVVIQIINEVTGIPINDISDVIQFIVSGKLLKKYNKVISFIKRHQLKKELKKFFTTV
jgi:hypothetical protein